MNVSVRVRQRPAVVPESPPRQTPPDGGLPSVFGALALKIAYRPIGELRPSRRNARTHSDKQIHKLMQSFQRFGCVSPVLVDEAGEVIAGHGRLTAPSTSPASTGRTCTRCSTPGTPSSTS
ncbi:MAG: ParB N-terminal domain-containing protein [Devosia sp.]|nr:ParB N-terminal domain-containing protein [Devosia sp.]